MTDTAKTLRKEALYLSHKCQDGNLQSVFSCLDIVWTLYDQIMRSRSNRSRSRGRFSATTAPTMKN